MQSTYSLRNQITEGYERDGQDFVYNGPNISATNISATPSVIDVDFEALSKSAYVSLWDSQFQ